MKSPSSSSSSSSFSSTVQTAASGILRGRIGADGVTEYLGIRYAVPPIGVLRWKPPQPYVVSADEEVDAKGYGPACYQVDPHNEGDSDAYPQSEDCLFLNVYAPTHVTSPLPVMIWIHGGVLIWGSSRTPLYNGSTLARQQDVIVVSIQYRLNAFGFVANPHYNASSSILGVTQPTSGNYGLLDQILALRWVNENIAAFGGDPENVSLFGWSAGSSSTCMHVVTPNSWPYFQKVMSESGTCSDGTSLSDAYDASYALAEAVGCPANMTEGEKSECLLAAPADVIARTCNHTKGLQYWGWVQDGVLIQSSVRDIISSGSFRSVPMIGGDCTEEASWGLPYYENKYGTPPILWPEVDLLCIALYRGNWRDMIGFYTPATYPTPFQAAMQMLSDYEYVCPIRQYYLAFSQHTPVYYYAYAHSPSWGIPSWGAYHGSDRFFLFGNAQVGEQFTVDEAAFSLNFQSYWAQFAKTNDPNDPSGTLPTWELYDPIGRKLIFLDLVTNSSSNWKGDVCDKFDTLYPFIAGK